MKIYSVESQEEYDALKSGLKELGLEWVEEDCPNKANQNITDKQDNINPSHYTQGGIQSIEYLKAKLTPEEYQGFLKGNILKYITREKLKNGKEDIYKAQWYLDRLVNEL